MPRYAAVISYNGKAFCGWQEQPQGLSVQGSINAALRTLEPQNSGCCGAGRTDGGVHARAQVAHFDMKTSRSCFTLRNALSDNVHEGIEIMRVREVPDDFHAIRSALWREYKYFIWNDDALYPHLAGMCWHIRPKLNLNLLCETIKKIRGTHDFGAFCRKNDRPQNSVRNMTRAHCSARGALITLTFRADGFLTNMVRILTGTLVDMARQKNKDKILRGDENFNPLLSADALREEAGRTAPTRGLFLWKVGYDRLI